MICWSSTDPASSNLFKVSSRNLKAMYEICSKLTIRHWVVLLSLLLSLNRFHKFFHCFHRWLWANKCQRKRNSWTLLPLLDSVVLSLVSEQINVFYSFMTEVSIIKKPVHWFESKLMNWFLYDRDLRHKGVKPLGLIPQVLNFSL